MSLNKLTVPNLGRFGRNELAFIGTSDSNVKELIFELTTTFAKTLRVAYVDADHQSSEIEKELGADSLSSLAHGACTELKDKITYTRVDFRQAFNKYELKLLFNDKDLIFINGNHFKAEHQVLILDGDKLTQLENKLHKLTDVKAIVMLEGIEDIPEFIKESISNIEHIPVYKRSQIGRIRNTIESFINEKKPTLNGLVLGNSNNLERRKYIYDLLNNFCDDTFMSSTNDEAYNLEGFNTIPELFMGLDSFGSLLSALRTQPDSAWLVISPEHSFINKDSLQYLLSKRNASKVATAFSNCNNGLPEPLFTVWEPRSYMILLQYLAQGMGDLSQILLNCRLEQLQTPTQDIMTNYNSFDHFDEVIKQWSM